VERKVAGVVSSNGIWSSNKTAILEGHNPRFMIPYLRYALARRSHDGTSTKFELPCRLQVEEWTDPYAFNSDSAELRVTPSPYPILSQLELVSL
jgi:hypothetical protein